MAWLPVPSVATNKRPAPNWLKTHDFNTRMGIQSMHSRCYHRWDVHRLFAVAVTLGIWFGVAHCQVSLAGDPPRLKRAESFLGLHLDFHASATDQNIGQNTTPEMVQAILDRVQPDYIQVDCKGHAGYSSYPTQVGNQAGSFVGNPIRVWRSVTAQRGVGLYMPLSRGLHFWRLSSQQ